MSHIKNIIFDLGGVLLDIDFHRTQSAFEDLGVHDYARFFSQHHASPLFQDLETGKISPTVFYEGLRMLSGLPVSDIEIKNAWNAMLGDYRKDSMDFLSALAANGYQLFLFSNTNQIHYESFAPKSISQNGRPLEDYFKKAYYSHTLGLRKPSQDAFLRILKEQQLPPAETLFVDDTMGNIEGAGQTGLQTYLLDRGQRLPVIKDLLI